MGNEDLGKHYQALGDLSKAFEAFSRMRQDVSMAKQIIGISKHLIEVAIEQKNWIVVTSNAQKIKAMVSPAEEEESIQPYLCAVEGLAALDAREYYNAALLFLKSDSGMGMSASTIISQNDVAVYGGLCALATMERADLRSKVLDNSKFRIYLELEPHIRRAIQFFVNSKYPACLAILEAYRTDYLLDIHLEKHIEELYHMVRTKSIVEFVIPFSVVTLDALSSAFMPTGQIIDKELVKMIQRKEGGVETNV